ncbi:beta-ketoacyl-ACP reductase [Massilia terrae]|nr:acetoacetyl-CoA reductase [Massilia terrae]
MDHQVALVTGGMGGLGSALCRRLERDGFRVAVTFSPAKQTPEAWLAAQRDDGFHFKGYKVDVADYADCEWMVQRLLADMGRLDVLVNNAGITRDRSLLKMTHDDWQAVLRTDLDSVFNITRQAIEPMLAQRSGRIINISSVNGQRGAFGQCNYSAAKAGMHGFTKALAMEMARHGITVNTVSPGYLRTKMTEQVASDIMRDKILPQIPVGRLGEPEEVAALVGWLASPEAGFVTGANIAINGGQHMA